MKKYDVCHPRSYTNANGEEKTHWTRCGVVIETDKGLRLKLEHMPLASSEDGLWFSLFEPKPKEGGDVPF